MQNKKIRLAFCLTCLTTVCSIQVATAGESTPYSQYGLGIIQDNDYVPSSSMGGLGAAYRSQDAFNYNNPASLSEAALTSFEAGLIGQFGRRKTNAGSAKIGTTGLDYLSMSFPVIRGHWGMGAGLLPYSSRISYTNDTLQINGQEGIIHNENDGQLYNFFWSNGFKYKEYSFGMNIGYQFGNLSNNELAYPLKDKLVDVFGFGTWYKNSLVVRSLSMTFGAQYHKEFKYGDQKNKTLALTVGLAGAPGHKLGKKSSLDESLMTVDANLLIDKSSSQSYKDFLMDLYTLRPTGFDTLRISENLNTDVHIPGYIQAGFTLADSIRWLIGFDYRYQPWSKYKGYGINSGVSLQNSWRIGVGGEFLPSLDQQKNFFSKLKYRAGFHYERTNLNISSSSINEFGINVGFGIPIVIKLYDEFNTRMYVYAFNLSFEAGSRGTLGNNLIRENYGKIKLGINLNSSWFQKRKYY